MCMKNKYICSLLSLFLTLNISAQGMKEIVKSMPQEIVPQLTHNNKLDMIDFLESNMSAKVKDIFDNECEMILLTDDYCKIKLSDVTDVDIKLMSRQGETIICLVRSYRVSLPKDEFVDSEIDFYSLKWEKLPTDRFFDAKLSDDEFTQIILSPDSDEIKTQKTKERITLDNLVK